MELSQAKAIAERFCTLLEPACERVQVAGSIRRKKLDVGDIEVLVEPLMVPRPGTLIADELIPATDSHVERLVRVETLLEFDDECRRNGQRLKRLVWGTETGSSRIAIDLFICFPPSAWGALMAIRTGPAGFSKLLVTKRAYGGAMPDELQQRDGALWGPSGRLDTPTEKEYFVAIGLPDWAPADRTEERLRAFLRNSKDQGGCHARSVAETR